MRRRQQDIETKSAAFIENQERIADTLAKLDEIHNDTAKAIEERTKETNRLAAKLGRLKETQRLLNITNESVAQRSFETGIHSMVSDRQIQSMSVAASRSTGSMGQALSMAQTMPTNVIQEQIAKQEERINAQRKRLQASSQKINEPGMGAIIESQANALSETIQKKAELSKAEQVQRQYGLDTKSIYDTARQTHGRIMQDRRQERITQTVAAGGLDRAEIEGKLAETTEKLVEAFGKLETAVLSGSDEAHRMAQEFNDTAEQAQEYQDTLKEMDRQGGGGGFGSRLQQAGQAMQGAGGVIGAYAGYEQYRDVTANLLDTQNRIGFGRLANMRFDDMRGAAGGDFTSLRRVLEDNYGSVAKGGLALGGEQAGVLKTRLLGQGVGTAGSFISGAMEAGAQGGKVAGPKGAIIAGIAGGVNSAAGAAAETAITAEDMRRGISERQVAIQQANQLREYDAVLNRVGDASGQRAMDTFFSMGQATRGLGFGLGNLTGTPGRPAGKAPDIFTTSYSLS
jgi:hypothetical protein